MLSPHPLCCPARAEILTGQYAQNNGVRSNKPSRHGGYASSTTDDTIATWLQDAGYSTAFVGKYLNGYHRPRHGIRARLGHLEPARPSTSTTTSTTRIYENGHPQEYSDEHSADLVGERTDRSTSRQLARRGPAVLHLVLARRAAQHLRRDDERRQLRPARRPPATRHAQPVPDATSPTLRDPSFNEEDVSRQAGGHPPAAPVEPSKINGLLPQRIRSLQAVDEAVERVTALRQPASSTTP